MNNQRHRKMVSTISNIPETTSDYVKFPNGIMMQWGTTQMNAPTSGGTLKRRGEKTVTFPEPFTSTFCSFANVRNWGTYWNVNTVDMTNTSLVLCLGGDSTTTQTVEWLVIGRWD